MPEEAAVERWLNGLGFRTEYEPDWIGGGGTKRPEFWADGPHNMWVEVKRATQEHATQQLLKLNSLAKPTPRSSAKLGSGSIQFGSETNEPSVIWVVNKLNAAVSNSTLPVARYHASYVEASGDEWSLEVDGPTPTVVYGKGGVTGNLPVPSGFEQASWMAAAKLRDAKGNVVAQGLAHEILDAHAKSRCCGSASLGNSTLQFSFAAFSFSNVALVDRARRQIKSANKKFRDAGNVKPAPGVLVIAPDPGVPISDEDVAVAALGDRAVTILRSTPAENFETSDVFLHRNGALRGGDCAGVSAVILWFEGRASILTNRRCDFALPERSPLFDACLSNIVDGYHVDPSDQLT